MRSVTIIVLLLAGFVLFYSCSKYKDPAPITDPRLTNPYCNDPIAVNYNWGFPGKPDNTICFYPTDVFKGTYVFTDSIYSASATTAGLFLQARVETLQIYALSRTEISVTGFCSNGNIIKMMAGPTYVATGDTTVGDSVTARGQLLCRTQDTVSGIIAKDRIDSTLLHVSLYVVSDTGATSHIGDAKKL